MKGIQPLVKDKIVFTFWDEQLVETSIAESGSGVSDPSEKPQFFIWYKQCKVEIFNRYFVG